MEQLKAMMIYSKLKQYVMSNNDRLVYGHPIEVLGQTSGQVFILNRCSGSKPVSNNFRTNIRQCHRCFTRFEVTDDGRPVWQEKCYHHRGSGNTGPGEVYTCCHQPYGYPACRVGPSHVVDGHGHSFWKNGYFVLPQPTGSGADRQVYALDCEMVSTTIGYELARITVVNVDLDIVFDQIVKPSNLILDYNTQFSGITETDMISATWTLDDVHKHMSTMMTNTIIVGHALNHDLKTLKLKHDLVIDTAQLFPHRKGLPFRTSLKYLAKRHLGLVIQGQFE